jgi:hypothetical protein
MAMRTRIVSTVLAVLFLLLYQVSPCSADLVHLSIEEMTEKADVILIGTVENILHSAASPYTILHMHRQVTVSVERFLKNKLETKTVTVVAHGATLGNLSISVSDQVEFQESERVLLFLLDDSYFLGDNPQGFYEVVGVAQGKFTVGSDSARGDYGHVIEDGLRVGDIKFNLGARSVFDNLVFPLAVALFGLGGIVFLYYRSRVST